MTDSTVHHIALSAEAEALCSALRARAERAESLNRDLRIALEESVKLQSHYAKLLNMHDGGHRIGFVNADAWIARLRETGTLPKVPSS